VGRVYGRTSRGVLRTWLFSSEDYGPRYAGFMGARQCDGGSHAEGGSLFRGR